jgi:hypothetical protein
MAKLKSFRLATEEQRYTKHAFVSFKTDPDEPTAKQVAELLRSRGLEVTFIHGDTTCPHPFGTTKANRWIRHLLSSKVTESRVLLSIASDASLRSPWVFQEFYLASQVAKLILMLWFSGPDPTDRFVPPPRQLTKRLPSCSVYLIDCRENAEERLGEVAGILHSLRRANRELFLRRAVMLMGLLALLVAPLFALFQLTPQPDDPLASLASSENMDLLMVFWIFLVFLLGTIIFPGSYRVPRPYRQAAFIRQIVPGFGLTRYVLLVLMTFSGFGLIPLGGLLGASIWAACAPVVGVAGWVSSRFLRVRLIRRSYMKSFASEVHSP